VEVGLLFGQFFQHLQLLGRQIPGDDHIHIHQQIPPARALRVGDAFAFEVLILAIHLVEHNPVPLTYLLLIQGVLNLLGQTFLLPGGGGTVEAGYAFFLIPYLAHEPFTLLVWRTFSFYWFLIVGGAIFL
jgi:uncharacterized membrane protein YbhN (UPF0104 family)